MPNRHELMRVAVIIPALDEEEGLKTLLPKLASVAESSIRYEFTTWVITEVSPSPQVQELIKHSAATCVPRSPSDSFGDAIRTGIQTIPDNTDIVIIMDADGSHPATTIPRLLVHVEHADVVVASRYVAGGSSDNSTPLRLMSRLLNITFALVLGIRCRDVSTNFKAYHAEDLRSLTLQCSNFDIVEEILVRLKQLKGRKGLEIVEIPDHFFERESGQSKRRLSVFVASYIWTLIRLRFGSVNSVSPHEARDDLTRLPTSPQP